MDECGCIFVDDGERSEFATRKMQVARKSHKCSECHREILPKEKYEHLRGKWDGVIDTYKTCLECLDIRNIFFCEGWIYGGMREYLRIHIEDMNGQISENCLIDLTPKARDYVCDMIEKYWNKK